MNFFIEHRLRLQTIRSLGKTIFLFIFFVEGIILCSVPVSAWEIKTHKELTEQAINIKAGVLDTYLKENLGLESGLNEVVDKKTVRQWMIEGSDFEDNLPRPRHHFHDALNNRGLESNLSGESAIDWSLAAVGEQSFGPYSWNDAREYYFKALTLPTKTERDEYWGKTFRALGQLMHLLQDSANPSHVRNDDHISLSGLGDVDGLHDYMARQSVSSYPGATFFTPDSSLLETEGAIRSEPFSNLFDTNTYQGANPGATLGTDVGITEFTNANFLSDDTIPGQSTLVLFPFPDVFELVPGPSSLPYLTLPRLGSSTFPAARAAKLTTNQAAAQYLLTNTHFDLIGKLELDDAVYDAQAQNLIPRAIDYSAAVLEYFFRGELPLIESAPDFNSYEVCHNPDGTFESQGFLRADLILSPELKFSGTGYLYYDLDGIRVLGQTLEISSSATAVHAGVPILLAQLPFFEPVRWTLVLEGQMGPGETEVRAILGRTELVPWLDRLCPI